MAVSTGEHSIAGLSPMTNAIAVQVKHEQKLILASGCTAPCVLRFLAVAK